MKGIAVWLYREIVDDGGSFILQKLIILQGKPRTDNHRIGTAGAQEGAWQSHTEEGDLQFILADRSSFEQNASDVWVRPGEHLGKPERDNLARALCRAGARGRGGSGQQGRARGTHKTFGVSLQKERAWQE